jgi:hypothetical protein
MAPTGPELRRGVLAVSVLNDLDIEPAQLGVTLTGTPSVWVSWGECRRALAGADPEQPAGRERLAAWLLARRRTADTRRSDLMASLRPVGLPVEHALHPGLDWVCERVMGGALDLGLGAVDLDPEESDRVVLLPPPALVAAGIDVDGVWPSVRRRLEELGALAAERALRDAKGVLKPMGDCDVVTLLGARSLRSALAEDGGGLGAAAVPMRRRGWIKLSLIDPAFAPAAAAASSAADRGFVRPLLLTADELTLVPEGGRPTEIVLRDPAAVDAWPRDVLYR